MSFDLAVGKSNLVKDRPDLIGSINFDELPHICALAKRIDSFFLNRMMNLFEDQRFSIEELEQAKGHLLPMMQIDLKQEERLMLHMLISAITYALDKQMPLHGIAN